MHEIPDPQAPLSAEALEEIRATAAAGPYVQAFDSGDRRRLLAEVDRLRASQAAALARVRELHRPRGPYCVVCDSGTNTDCTHQGRHCRICHVTAWPCPTIRAVDTTTEEGNHA